MEEERILHKDVEKYSKLLLFSLIFSLLVTDIISHTHKQYILSSPLCENPFSFASVLTPLPQLAF